MPSNPSDQTHPGRAACWPPRGVMQNLRLSEASAEDEPLPEIENTPAALTPSVPTDTPARPPTARTRGRCSPAGAVSPPEPVARPRHAARGRDTAGAPEKWKCPICTAECARRVNTATIVVTTSPNFAATVGSSGGNSPAPRRVGRQDRYTLDVLERAGGVARFQGTDHGGSGPQPVIVLRQELPPAAPLVAEEVAEPVSLGDTAEEEFLPTFDEVPAGLPVAGEVGMIWPSLEWEHVCLRPRLARHPRGAGPVRRGRLRLPRHRVSDRPGALGRLGRSRPELQGKVRTAPAGGRGAMQLHTAGASSRECGRTSSLSPKDR
jgi:hypothetical protein